jgi:hypothetical protein
MVTYGNPALPLARVMTLLVLAAVALDAAIARVRSERAPVDAADGGD